MSGIHRLFGLGNGGLDDAVREMEDRAAGDRSEPIDIDRSGSVGRAVEAFENVLADRRRLESRVESLETELAERDTRLDRLKNQVEQNRDVMQACAAGRLVERMDDDGGLGLATDFNEMMDELETAMFQLKSFVSLVVDSSDEVLAGTEEVESASEQITISIQEISDGAADQTAQLQSLNDEMETLSSNIKEIADTAREVATLSDRTATAGSDGRNAATAAIDGMEAIEAEAANAVEAIEELEAETEQIGEITDFITEMANETNMLALNANIEASRSEAGDDGFAVVADEVKTLSEKTKAAAERIESRLDRIEGQTSETAETVQRTRDRIDDNTDAVRQAATALEDIAGYAEQTDSGVNEIKSAAGDQAQSAREVVSLADETAVISEQTANLTQTVAAAAEEQTATLATVSDNAKELAESSSWLSDTLDMFKVRQGDVAAVQTVDTGSEPTVSSFDGSNVLGTRVGTASAKGDSGHETARLATQKALSQLDVRRVDFCQVFCSPRYEYADVLDGICDVVGDDVELVGCSSSGEFTDSTVVSGSVTVSLVASDTVRFFTGIGTGLSENVTRAVDEAVSQLPSSVDGFPHRSAINLHDGLAGVGDQVALVTQRKLGHDTSIAGGSAGDDMNMDATHVFCDDTVKQDAVVIVLVASKRPTTITVNHGHEPISEPVTVTRSDGGTVYELDGRPAFDVWKAAINEHVSRKRAIEIDFDSIEDESKQLASLLTEYEFGIEVDEGPAEGHKIRWPGLTTTTDGPMDFAVSVPEGTALRVMHSPKPEQIESARQTARRAVENAGPTEVAGAFVYDCVCRATILDDDFREAIKAMRDELGVPFAGFETYGEVCLERGQMSGYHNTTSVVMLLPR